jgi:hypothetical protein
MSKLNNKVAELADYIRHWDTLEQLKATVYEQIATANAELQVLLRALPKPDSKTTEQLRKEVQDVRPDRQSEPNRTTSGAN